MIRLDTVLRIARFELSRQLRRKTTIFVIILMVLPFIAALVLKKSVSTSITLRGNPELLWSIIAGVNIGAMVSGSTGLLSLSSVFGWWWIIIALYTGDVLASDIEKGVARLILSRSISRIEYVSGKVLGVLAILFLVTLAGVFSIVGASWIMVGHQSRLDLALLTSLAVVIGSLPLLLIGALVGAKVKKGIAGIIVVFAVYFISQLIISILSIYTLITHGGGNVMEEMLRVKAYIPFDGGMSFAALIFSHIYYGGVIGLPSEVSQITIGENTANMYIGPIATGSIVKISVVSIILWSALISGLLWYLFRKMDL